MSHDHDKEALVNKFYPDPEHRLALDYVAEQAAREVMATHMASCPFERKMYGMAGKAAIGFLTMLVCIGAVVYGVWQAHTK